VQRSVYMHSSCVCCAVCG